MIMGLSEPDPVIELRCGCRTKFNALVIVPENLIIASALKGENSSPVLTEADAMPELFANVRAGYTPQVGQRPAAGPDILIVARMSAAACGKNCVHRFVLKENHNSSSTLNGIVGS